MRKANKRQRRTILLYEDEDEKFVILRKSVILKKPKILKANVVVMNKNNASRVFIAGTIIWSNCAYLRILITNSHSHN